MTNKTTYLFIALLMILAILLGYNYFFRPLEGRWQQLGDAISQQEEDVQVAEEETSPADIDPVTELLEELSAEQIVSQVIAAPYTISDQEWNEMLSDQQATSSAEAGEKTASVSARSVEQSATQSASLRWMLENHPGIVTFFGDSISSSSAKQVSDYITRKTNGIKPLFAVDHEGGTVQRFSGLGFTEVPSFHQLCEAEVEERNEVLQKSAQELASVGIDVVLAPVVDFGDSPTLKSRICSNSPEVVIQGAKYFIEAFRKEGILPVLKHFPGIGKTKKDLHSSFDTVTIEADEASVYARLLNDYPDLGVMVTHVGVTNQYPNVPCSLSSVCVREIHDNFPQALVMTDALEMKSALEYQPEINRSVAEVAVDAIRAGNNVLIFGPSVTATDLDAIEDALLATYESDKIFQEKVNLSARKILEYKQAQGRLE